MLIKRMELKNFRQFKGEQEIDFSTDTTKNVTVVMGENGAGKTTLEQAFTWCLYGKVDFQKAELINREVRDDLRVNDKAVVAVRLYVLYRGIEYRITRTQKCSPKSVRSSDEIFSVEERNANGDWSAYNQTQAHYMVNEMLPESLAGFFFFDGEHINKMSTELLRNRKSIHFQDAVRGLSGLNAIYEAIEHFGDEGKKLSVIGKIASQIDNSGNERLERIAKENDEWNSKKDKAEKRLDEIEPEIERFNNDITENNRKLGALNTAINNRRRYEELGNANKKLQQSLEDGQKSLLSFFSTNFCGFIQMLHGAKINETLKNSKKIDVGVPDITSKAIEFLLKRGRCVCGAHLTHDKSKVKCLQELIMDLPPHSLNVAIGNFKDDMHTVEHYGDQFFDELWEKGRNLGTLRGEIDSNENERSMIIDSISNQDEVTELRHKIELAKKYYKEYNDEKISCRVTLRQAEAKLNANKAERDKLLVNDTRNKKNRVYLQYAERILQDLKDVYKEREEDVRKELEKNINEIFEEIYDGGIHISVDKKYHITTTVNASEYLQDGTDIEQNTAQSYAIIFAFISGIIELSKRKRNKSKGDGEEEDDVYPLVMDAPLSSFDKRRIKQICEELPKIAEQVIILIKDTDGEVAEKYLNNHIGARWQMVVERATSTRVERRG